MNVYKNRQTLAVTRISIKCKTVSNNIHLYIFYNHMLRLLHVFEKNDSRACTKFLLLLYPYSQASLYVSPHSRRQGSVRIFISRLPMQDSIGEDSINNFAAHIFTLFLTALNFDFQIKIINTTKYILEWSCWAYLYKFIEIIISELIYVLYTVLFYNFPDTNIIGWLHWEFTDLSVVTLPVLV